MRASRGGVAVFFRTGADRKSLRVGWYGLKADLD